MSRMKRCKTCYLINAKPCYECSACASGDDHYKYWPNTQTNADHIRSMSNMELAEMLVRYDSNLYRYYCPDGSFCDDEDSALSFALDWLDKPAKEEYYE